MEKLYDKSFLEMVESLPQFEEYEFWKNLQNRKIIFNREFDFSLVERAIMQIINWNEEDDKNNLFGDERPEIKIYLYSNGGDVLSLLGLLDTIRNSKTTVHTICVGLAASCGALLLIGSHRRTIYKNSTVLLHDGGLSLSNSAKKAKNTMAFYDKIDLRIKEFILKHTKISEELFDSKSDEEWYIFGDEALELGIVDYVI